MQCDLYRWNGSAWILIEGSVYLVKAGVVDAGLLGAWGSSSPGNSSSLSAVSEGGSLNLSAYLTASDGTIPRFHYNKAVDFTKYKTLTVDYQLFNSDNNGWPQIELRTASGGGTLIAQFRRLASAGAPGASSTGPRTIQTHDISAINQSLYITLVIGTNSAGVVVATRFYNISLA